jgi:CPA1 family monovalent cation:H+ antiporter
MPAETPLLELLIGLIFLLLVAAGVRVVTNRIKLPFSVLLVFTGIFIRIILDRIPAALNVVREFDLSSEMILFIFLPTLIYESSQALDVRELKKNLTPILTLAVPGLLLSTFLIGVIVWLLTPLDFAVSLLLGAILSATDPVAVISIFKKLGGPKRLLVLIEGESLFNDATSLVLSRILVAIIVGGGFTLLSAGQGIISFFVVFFGGILVGAVLGFAAGVVLERVRSETFVVITITTVLAYLSFIVAEELFHVSGVMAVVAAGLSFSGWGWMKITPSVRNYLENFWEYAAFLANALIFLLVGLHVQLAPLGRVLPILGCVIAGMLLSRAVIVYGLTPLVDLTSRNKIFLKGYKPVLFWGGLRGAVALAIVLSLPRFGQNVLLENLVIGAVLFTLFVEGLTIEPLVKLLGLNKPPLTDQYILHEHRLMAKEKAYERISGFLSSTVFSAKVADRLKTRYKNLIEKEKQYLSSIQEEAARTDQQRRILYIESFGEELTVYMDLFNKGHLGQHAFRELRLDLALQIDAVRYMENFRNVHYGRFHPRRIERLMLTLFDHLPLLSSLSEKRRRTRFAVNYEISWGHREGSSRVLKSLDTVKELNSFPSEMVDEVIEQYTHWYKTACTQLDETAEQFPEFVHSTQHQLGERLALLAERDYVENQMDHGSLPHSFGEQIIEEIDENLYRLRQEEVAEFEIDPHELLRKVAFFKDMGEEEFDHIAERMAAKTVNEKDVIIRQGDAGNSLFLITRGVVRVTREENGERRDLSTLLAGDFFGEMALLHGEKRNATVWAVTPCYLYELHRTVLEEAMEEFPAVREAMYEADRKRRADQ